MSDGGINTNLEQLFLSREFGKPDAAPDLTGTQRVRVAVPSERAVTPVATQLDHIFLSAQFGRVRPGGGARDRVDLGPHSPGATVLALRPATALTRQRMVAAISGVAAAALVVVGVTSGTLHSHRSGSGPAQQASASIGGRRLPSAPSRRGSHSSGDPDGSFGATAPPSSSTSGAGAGTRSGIVVADDAAGEAPASPPVLAGSMTSPGPAAVPIPAPVGPSSPTPSSPTPTSASTVPSVVSGTVSSVVGVVVGASSTAGNNIRTTSAQLAAALPAAAPLTGSSATSEPRRRAPENR